MKNNTFDTIYINELQIPCIIGVFDYERTGKQIISLSLALSVDLRKAGKTDNVADTVSYQLYKKIVDFIEQSQYRLLEALAEAVAGICLEDKRVRQVKVYIEKPKAVKLGRSSAVEIIRNQD